MKWKNIAAAAAMAALIAPAMAADQSITLVGGNGSFIGTGPLLAGGDDVISFLGVAPGMYNIDFTMSSQFANIPLGGVTVNGQTALQVSFGQFEFFGLTSIANSPFIVTILGSGANPNSAYSGQIHVSAIPEPESYAMMLAGLLGIVGFVRRRRYD